MTIETFGFPIIFIVVIAMLLWVLTDTRGKWWVKSIIILVTLSVSGLVWNSVEGMLGWSTSQKLDGNFELHGVVIQEPSKKTSKPGGIFVLVQRMKLLDDSDKFVIYSKRDKKEPRLYRINYSQKRHQQMQKLKEKLKKGKKVYITTKGKEKGKGQNKGGKDSGGNGSEGFENDQKLEIYELPPAKGPQKNYSQQ